MVNGAATPVKTNCHKHGLKNKTQDVKVLRLILCALGLRIQEYTVAYKQLRPKIILKIDFFFGNYEVKKTKLE